jgi:hypothetical protein
MLRSMLALLGYPFDMAGRVWPQTGSPLGRYVTFSVVDLKPS